MICLTYILKKYSNFSNNSNQIYLRSLKNGTNKAAGIDDFNGRFLKDGADILTIPITQICNLSIKFSQFPEDCKVAKLKTLYKK